MSHALDSALMRALTPYLTPAHRILNLPSGDGDLSRQIEAHGGRVTSADLFPEFSTWKPDEVVTADMNERLPFADQTFDALVCQEGIEHLENLPLFFAECRRVLRQGGCLFLTTPNFMDLSSRLAWFLTGIKGFRGHFPNEESTIWGIAGDRIYHGHAFMLPFFQIRYLLRLNQFADIEVEGVKSSGVAWLLYVLMRPFLGGCIGFVTSRRRRRDQRNHKAATSPALQRELLGFALSRDLLVGKTILVKARRREGSFAPNPMLEIHPGGAAAPVDAAAGSRAQ